MRARIAMSPCACDACGAVGVVWGCLGGVLCVSEWVLCVYGGVEAVLGCAEGLGCCRGQVRSVSGLRGMCVQGGVCVGSSGAGMWGCWSETHQSF